MDYEATKQKVKWRYDFDPVFHALVEEGVRFALATVVVPGHSEDLAEAARWGIGAALLMEEVQKAADEDEQEPPPKGEIPIASEYTGLDFMRRLFKQHNRKRGR